MEMLTLRKKVQSRGNMKTIPIDFDDGICTLKGEIRSKCPITEQDDYYQFTITYTPKDKIIEIYSLKDFIKQYESLKMFQEEITIDLYDKLTITLNCPVKVVLEDNSPGIQLKTELKNV